MSSCVVGMSKSGQVGLSISFLVVLGRSQQIQQRPVESLNHTIPHRMIGCSAGLLHSCKVAEALDQLRLEVSFLVTMDSGREPIVNEDVLVEKSSSGVCRLVSRWNGLGIARKMVGYHEHIFDASFRWFNGQVVYANYFHGCGRRDVDEVCSSGR